MRIVQTFWTAGHDPLKYSFGWSHPEYNLMSWALSCLSLRKHYDDVELYTDSVGYHILIDVLKLPYTKTHVVFDDFKCLPQHWALSKIKTYSMQTEPFIHVDGDVYLSKPLPEKVLEAPLVAQNKEIGTDYYRRMVDKGILCYPSIQIPEFIREEVMLESIPSYNAGFLGGRDLDFIHAYCEEVFKFVDGNKLNDPECPHSKANCNVFFEQAFFATLSDLNKKDVFCIYGKEVRDNGYCVESFCDLDKYTEHPFFHLLGGHKGNKIVLKMLKRALLLFYPGMLVRILSLFPKRHYRFDSVEYRVAKKNISYYPEICKSDIQSLISSWECVKTEELVNWERIVAKSIVESVNSEVDTKYKIRCSPWLHIYALPQTLEEDDVLSIKKHLVCSEKFPLDKIVLVPVISGYGFTEYAISEIAHNMLLRLSRSPCTVLELEKFFYKKFCIKAKEEKHILNNIILSELYSMRDKFILYLFN